MPAPKKPIGRPPLVPGDTPAQVKVTVPSRLYDRAYAAARRDDISIAEIMRRGLVRVLRDRSE